MSKKKLNRSSTEEQEILKLEILEHESSSMSKERKQELLNRFEDIRRKLDLKDKELQATRLKLKYSNDHTVKFYNDISNVYLTLDKNATVIKLNLTTTKLINDSNSSLIGKKLNLYIHQKDKKKSHKNTFSLLQFNRKKSWQFKIKQAKCNNISSKIRGTSILYGDKHFKVLKTQNKNSKSNQLELTIEKPNDQVKAKIINKNTAITKNHSLLKQRFNALDNIKQELAKKEAMLNSIFNAAIEGIVTIDQSGIIVSLNKTVTTIFGYQQEELIGTNVNILMPSPHKDQHDTYIKKYLETNQASIIGKVREIDGQRKDGSLVTLDISIAEFIINQKRYFTSILRDVSERKRKEIKDKEHLAELAHVTRLGLMGEMASGIAHEINQPLTAIAAYTQACLKFVENEKIDCIILKDILHKINNQSLLAGHIIHQMRSLVSSKIIQKSLVDINTLIHDAVDLCKSECKQIPILIKYNLASSLPPLFIDIVQIEQVLLNLIRNSIEALHQLPENKLKQLEIQTYLNEDHHIEIRIKDYGPGLDKLEQANIFTPFYTTKQSGMGMGLSISRSIVEAHNGTLSFNSKKGLGTTFYFILPIELSDDKN